MDMRVAVVIVHLDGSRREPPCDRIGIVKATWGHRKRQVNLSKATRDL